LSVRLRMKRMGSKKRPFYRIVAADSRYQRDGRFLEILGYYDPKSNPMKFVVDSSKVFVWLDNGAEMSNTVETLLRKEGIVQQYNLKKIELKAKNTAAKEKSPKIEKPVESAE
jgi:small subunit ribosomal protein S16